MIMIILLAVLALIVVKALVGSPWGTFTVFRHHSDRHPDGPLQPLLPAGRIGEMSAIGIVLLLAAIFFGRTVAESEALAPLFNYKGETLALILIGTASSLRCCRFGSCSPRATICRPSSR